MGIRRKSREVALQALYQAELCGFENTDFVKLTENFQVAKKAIPYAMVIVDGIARERQQIDEIMRQYAKNWRVDRMSVIDRNLLRIGIYELLFQDDVPASVAINESIEIAKRFGTDDSSSFINGILDAIRDDRKKQ